MRFSLPSASGLKPPHPCLVNGEAAGATRRHIKKRKGEKKGRRGRMNKSAYVVCDTFLQFLHV